MFNVHIPNGANNVTTKIYVTIKINIFEIIPFFKIFIPFKALSLC